MSNLEQQAALYRELAKTDVYKQLKEACERETDSIRRNASKSQDTAYGELKFADGIDWVFDYIKRQQNIDKFASQ